MRDHDPIRLDDLDPAARDPGYWRLFYGEVLARAESELARRRARHAVTVSQVVRSWAGAVVPAALAAAAAAIFLAPAQPSTRPAEERLAGVEEVLAEGPDDGSFLALVSDEGAGADAEPEGF